MCSSLWQTLKFVQFRCFKDKKMNKVMNKPCCITVVEEEQTSRLVAGA